MSHIDARHVHAGVVQPPLSKSDVQRALVLAHACDVTLHGLPPDAELPGDVRALRAGLHTLRTQSAQDDVIDCHDGGAPFRFLLAQACVTPDARVRLTGTARLGERPHAPLLASLRGTLGPIGLELREGTPWPVSVHAPSSSSLSSLSVPAFTVSALGSSQYATALLLASASRVMREQRAWELRLEGALASVGYLDLTVVWLSRMGFVVDVTANCVRVESHAEPLTLPTLPGDWSSLGYLLLCAWRSGGVVALVDREAAHPDAFMLDVLAQAGLQVIDDVDGTHVTGSATSGVRASGAVCPDLLPTVAALACVLPQPSTLHAVSILRDKESDRLRGIEELVHAAGGRTSLHDDTLTIVPGTVPAHLVLQSHHDHRMAMAAATLAVLSGATLELDDVTCVAKSFPQFFAELHKLGVVLTTL